jgi:hypothetical protein
MGNVSEIKSVFTVDLTPFVDGLKTMLSMTAATAPQMKALMNLDVKAPNLSGLESQLKGLTTRTAEYLKEQAAGVPLVDGAAISEKKHGEAADNAGKALTKKSESLRHVKREALESFGAISFLALGIVQLTSTATGGSQKLDKLSNSLSAGISAGFGFAGMISMIAPSAGPAAAGIGILAAAAISLIKYFDDGEARAKRFQMAVDGIRQSMRGASTSDLEAYRGKLIESSIAAQENAKAYDKVKQSLGAMDFAGRAIILQKYNAEMARSAEFTKEREVVEAELTAREKTAGEVRQYIRDVEIAATRNQFDQQRKAVDETYRKEQEDYKGHADALEAARKKHATAIAKIVQDEAQFNQQIADTRFETELNRIKQQESKKGIVQEQIDLMILQAQERHYREQYQKLSALGDKASKEQIQQKAQLESRLSQIELQESEKRIEIGRNEFAKKIQNADRGYREIIAQFKEESYVRGDSAERLNANLIDLEETYTRAKLDAYQERIDKGEVLNQQELDQMKELDTRLTELSAEGTQARIELHQAESQAIFEGVSGIVGNLASAAQTMMGIQQQQTTKEVNEEKKQRLAVLEEEKKKRLAKAQTAEEKDKIEQEYAVKKEALDAEMEAKEKEKNRSAFETQKAFSIATALIATYEAATKAYDALSVIPIVGPALGIAAAAAAIIAGLANVAAIKAQEVPGLKEGGDLPAGSRGYIEGYEDEFVAPKRTFLQLFRSDLMPEMVKVMTSGNARSILLPQIKEEVLTASSAILRQNVREIAAETVRSMVEAGQQSVFNNGLNSNQSKIEINIKIENLIGTDEYVRSNLKPAIEKLMRELGASSVTEIFLNKTKQATNA